MPGETQNPDPRDTERDKFDNVDIDAITLAFGGHASRQDGMCLLEAVAYVAGEPHTDRPQCVCPVLAAFGREWNDALPDKDRDRLLKPFIGRLIGTRSTVEVQERRAYMAADWLVRVYTPVWLRAAGMDDAAAELEALPPLTSVEACVAARPVIDRAKGAAEAARDAARAAARAAAWADAVAAALDATNAAAGYAAIDAAVADARADARDAAVDAAAATDAAFAVAAAGAALRPHVEQLQNSAVDLYRRMIEVAA